MLIHFLAIIRWPNLLMLAGIQFLVYSKLLNPTSSILTIADIALVVIITMLIGAGGYVINDYYDAHIDSINKPDKQIAGTVWSLSFVKKLFWILTFIGLLFSVWLATRLGLSSYLFIYPVSIAGLWFYSYALKCKPFIGNIWVSLFCAGVIMIIALPDILLDNKSAINNDLWYYIQFAFLATFLREIIKDIEDLEGDLKANCRTVPVSYGLKTGKIIAVILGVLLIIALLLWESKQDNQIIKLLLLVLQGSTVGALAFMWWAKDKSYYHHASTIIKLVMLVGTFILFFYP